MTNILKAGIRLQRGCLRSVVGAFTCVVAGAAAGVPAAAADLDIGGGYGGAPAYVAEEFSWTGSISAAMSDTAGRIGPARLRRRLAVQTHACSMRAIAIPIER